MTYKLTNLTDNTTTICEKVTIEGFDYYVNDTNAVGEVCGLSKHNVVIRILNGYSATLYRKIIATTNPSLPIPQVVDEAEFFKMNWEKLMTFGYVKIQHPANIEQTHKWTDEDMCDLIQQLKDYTHESLSILGHDEREPIEFLEIFKSTRQTQVYCK